jgi:hypothetical protein
MAELADELKPRLGRPGLPGGRVNSWIRRERGKPTSTSITEFQARGMDIWAEIHCGGSRSLAHREILDIALAGNPEVWERLVAEEVAKIQAEQAAA